MTAEQIAALRGIRPRLHGLDRLRGLAVALMLLDHVLEVTHTLTPLRFTVTRLSMPLFFIVSGHLLRRLTWRHLGIGLVGLVLPVLVPWIDTPNVLLWYALGAVVLVGARPRFAWAVVVAALVCYANGYGGGFGNSYEPLGLWALMAVGRMVTAGLLLDLGHRLPVWLGRLGRYPLTVYVGHLLLLEGLMTL